MEVNATKTFDEFLSENPNFYNNVSGYSWDNETKSWVNTGIDQATQTLLEEWFGLRTICDDENFTRFFKRAIDLNSLRYANLKRIELTAFDPFVADYTEKRIERNDTNTQTGSKSSSNVSEKEVTFSDTRLRADNLQEQRTDNLSESNTNNSSSTDSRDISTTDTPNLTTTENTSLVGANKSAPQSISYAGATAGTIPSLDWSYMTAQEQQKGQNQTQQTGTTINVVDEDDSRSSTSTDQKTNTGTQTIVNTGSQTTTDTGTRNEDGTVTGTEQNSVSITGASDTKEIATGREGILPQEALDKAVRYLRTSSAFEWFRKQLEPCFLSIYDI